MSCFTCLWSFVLLLFMLSCTGRTCLYIETITNAVWLANNHLVIFVPLEWLNLDLFPFVYSYRSPDLDCRQHRNDVNWPDYIKSNFHVIRSLHIKIYIVLWMYITVKGMSRWSIQRIKAMLLCIEYSILFVNTVHMKIKVCNALNAMLCGDCQNWCFYTS